MKPVPKILFLFIVTCIGVYSYGQQVEVNNSIDKDWILIGDHVTMDITISCPANATIVWPEINDTITDKVEVIRKLAIDTTFLDQTQETALFSQKLVITSFDSGFHVLPPFVILYQLEGEDEFRGIETEALLLKVSTMDVDMEDDIMDISPLIDVPLSFREILPWLFGALGLVLIILILIYFFRKRKKSEPMIQIRKKPVIPPHQVALEALQSLKSKKLWQTGRVKDYHTELTDITRTYISDKFKIHATEMVTYEILDELADMPISSQTKLKLKEMLEMADMVKFAKGNPLPDEQERSMNFAIDFVKDTIFLIEEDNNNTKTDV